MNVQQSHRRPGFTLVELMTVIAIIVLLVSILIPALSAARTQAKKAATSGLLGSLDRGCEMFHTDFKHYPQSRGYNPFEGSDINLMGAQWLALQLTGADTRGFVEPTLKNDSNDDKVIDENDWLDWYSLNPARQYTRMGPYAEVDAKSMRSVEQIAYHEQYVNPSAVPPELLGNTTIPPGTGGTSAWHNGHIPLFLDAFGYPVLYYRANPKVDAPFTTETPSGNFVVGRYDQTDNAFFTGSEGGNGRYDIQHDGWDLSFSGSSHPLKTFGYDVDNPNQWPSSPSSPTNFAVFVCDANIYENTATGSGGRVWPCRADSFLLIAAEEDGLYGTGDDITNFGAGGGGN